MDYEISSHKIDWNEQSQQSQFDCLNSNRLKIAHGIVNSKSIEEKKIAFGR